MYLTTNTINSTTALYWWLLTIKVYPIKVHNIIKNTIPFLPPLKLKQSLWSFSWVSKRSQKWPICLANFPLWWWPYRYTIKIFGGRARGGATFKPHPPTNNFCLYPSPVLRCFWKDPLLTPTTQLQASFTATHFPPPPPPQIKILIIHQ